MLVFGALKLISSWSLAGGPSLGQKTNKKSRWSRWFLEHGSWFLFGATWSLAGRPSLTSNKSTTTWLYQLNMVKLFLEQSKWTTSHGTP